MSKEAIKNLLMDFMADYDPNKWSNDDVYEKYAEKIDNVRSMGELIAITELTKKVKKLETRLANCIEPKFKIGQEVYTIDKSRANYIGTGTITEIRLDEFGIVYKFTMFKSNYSESYNYKKEQDLFATEEEAKAKLEEMKNDDIR